MADSAANTSRDLARGVTANAIADGGMILGYVGEDQVLLARTGDRLFAVGAHCTHYHGPLAEGLVVGDTVRCPWHHACFSLETGEALRAPALDPIACWRVERIGDQVFVRDKMPQPSVSTRSQRLVASASLIHRDLGGGAAGLAAADMLRREAYDGPITMISADQDPPVDRPNLSKDFLAGEAKDDGFRCGRRISTVSDGSSCCSDLPCLNRSGRA